MQLFPIILLVALVIVVSAIVVKLIRKALPKERQIRRFQLLKHSDIQEALKAGGIIEAIQLLHQNHNMELMEAKQLIDEYVTWAGAGKRPSDNSGIDKPQIAISDPKPDMVASEKATVTGEVWINDSNAHVRFVPYIGDHGFSLQNEGTWGGPHTEIFLKSDYLASCLEASSNSEVQIDLNGPSSVGEISQLKGYPAADEGTLTRWIPAATARIVRKVGRLRFEFSGETDYLDPRTVKNTQSDLKSAGCYAFQIWFEICDPDLPLYFKNQVALDAVTAYANRVQLGFTNCK